ncbi:M28 family peptidase [Paenibacillus segetis]|uniref:Peptidase M28 domain-containing protein n=1 Tax=Paenibacillus segetis TaxID=1325360 RepID=A0ABQ1Y3I0_9BACL|nr:M28 family peptidase [Paenibacillus segetis]GGH10387.1 hypothetical protein GCM10008013_01810 [Paenibacillus segetis]
MTKGNRRSSLLLAGKLFILMSLIVSITLPNYAHAAEGSAGKGFEIYSVIKELSDAKYKGRVPGTLQYKQAANYIKEEFNKLGIAPLGKEHVMSYTTSLGTFKEKPNMTLDGKPLSIMEDFKPHGQSGSGTIKGNSVIFVGKGYPEDLSSINVTKQIVLMDSDIKPDKALGVADRIALLKQKGAKAVLLLPTAFYPIQSYERPLNGSDTGIVSIYVRKDLFGTANLNTGDKLSKQVDIQVAIDRKPTVDSQNVIAMIPGKDTHRTLIISATLDGLGYIPNGATFGAASMNASGVAAVLSLAQYYKEHQPATNIVFAVIGSETTNRDGIKAFMKNYESTSATKIIGFFNLYDLGGMKQNQKLYATATDKSPIETYLKQNVDVAYTENGISELYNFNNPIFESKAIPNAFFRGADSIDTLKDTAEAINVPVLKKHMNTIQIIADQFMNDPQYAIYMKPSTVQPDDQGMVFVPEVGHKMKFFSTKYFDIYYETDRWTKPEELAKKIDRVYENIAWWNYFPQDNGRIKVYYTNSYEDNWATAHRSPEPQNKTSGALQSPDNHSISVVYLPGMMQNMVDSLGTIYHELNHNLATYKLMDLGYGNWFKTEVQEIQGHANNYESKEMGYKVLRSSLEGLLQKPLSEMSWDHYVSKLEPGKELDTTYNQTASLIFYIYNMYNEEKGREFAYRMYTEHDKPLKDIVQETLGVDFGKFLEGWYDWFHGKEVKVPSFKMSPYDLPINQKSAGDIGGTESSNQLTTVKGGLATTNMTSQDLLVTSISATKNGTNAIFSISYTSKKKRSFLLFDPPNGSNLNVRDVIKAGTSTLKVTVPINDLKKVNNLTMNIFDNNENNFIDINMDELAKIIK